MKSGMLVGGVTLMYFFMTFRANSQAGRDAVLEHYMGLHEGDFERTSGRNLMFKMENEY